MKTFFNLLFAITLFSCRQTKEKPKTSLENYNIFDKKNHFQPILEKTRFDTLYSWDFGFAIVEPMFIASAKEDEKDFIKKLSPGQKALYFFWYLDAEVSNGGFIQFYWNYQRQFVLPIIDGLNLIGDTAMINLIDKADREYLVHKDKFVLQRKKDNWEPLYENLKKFNEYDSIYFEKHDKTIELIEKYAKKHSSDFVKFE